MNSNHRDTELLRELANAGGARSWFDVSDVDAFRAAQKRGIVLWDDDTGSFVHPRADFVNGAYVMPEARRSA